jgi:hypothetical protein
MDFDGCPPSPQKKGQNKPLFMQKEHSAQLVPEYCLCSPYSQQMCFQTKREIDLRTGKSLCFQPKHESDLRSGKPCVSKRNLKPISSHGQSPGRPSRSPSVITPSHTS